MPIRKKILFYLAIILTIIYSVWRIVFSIPWDFRIIDIVFGIILLVAELIGFVEMANYMYGMTRTKELERPEIPLYEYPDVDVFIPTCNEDKELLYKTINGCQYMDYPDKSKVHIYLLDDGDRPEIAQFAREMGVGYFRRDDNEGAKAGNINNALRQTTSPLVATFDADMIPMHDFLTHMVPYFFMDRYEKDDNGVWKKREEVDEDKKVGFIQCPQSFYNTDLFQFNLYSEKNVPNEQDYFFKTIQLARNINNSAVFAGSNAILARDVLEEIGGFYEKSITEDLATGIKIQEKDYGGYSIGSVHASGLAPTDLRSLFKQRDRWARGCIQTIRKSHVILNKDLSIGQKFNYFACLLYWYTPLRRLVFILSPILYSLFRIRPLDCSLVEILIFWLPHYIFFTWVVSSLTGNVRNARLSNVYDTIMFPHLIVGVVLETFGIKKKKFSVTNKNKVEGSLWDSFKLSIVHIILFVASLIGIVICIKNSFAEESAAYIIILFWLCVNLYSLLLALFFYLGRKYQRETDRMYVEVPASLQFTAKGIEKNMIVHTESISEGGMSFLLEKPYYIPDKELINLVIRDENGRYETKTKGMIVSTKRRKDKWFYALKFSEAPTKHDKEQLLQIVYDREPALPKKVSRKSSYYADLKNNIINRLNHEIMSRRKLPRIDVNRMMRTDSGHQIMLLNFNYEFVLLKLPATLLNEDRINLVVSDKIELKLKMVSSESRGKNFSVQLYSVMNYEEIIDNPQMMDIILKWIDDDDANRREIKAMMKQSKKVNENEFDEMKYL